MKIPNLEKINKDFSARLNLSSEANNIFHSLFIQTWPTTSLGFSRIGGDCLTSAYTVIITSEDLSIVGVYFEDRFAYIVHAPNDRFWRDVANRDMRYVSECCIYQDDWFTMYPCCQYYSQKIVSLGVFDHDDTVCYCSKTGAPREIIPRINCQKCIKEGGFYKKRKMV